MHWMALCETAPCIGVRRCKGTHTSGTFLPGVFWVCGVMRGAPRRGRRRCCGGFAPGAVAVPLLCSWLPRPGRRGGAVVVFLAPWVPWAPRAPRRRCCVLGPSPSPSSSPRRHPLCIGSCFPIRAQSCPPANHPAINFVPGRYVWSRFPFSIVHSDRRSRYPYICQPSRPDEIVENGCLLIVGTHFIIYALDGALRNRTLQI